MISTLIFALAPLQGLPTPTLVQASSNDQTTVTPVVTVETVAMSSTTRVPVFWVDGDEDAFGIPFGELRVRLFDETLSAQGPAVTLGFNKGRVDAATNPELEEGYVLVGFSDYFGGHNDAQVRLFYADGTPVGGALTLDASGPETFAVSSGFFGGEQGFFAITRVDGASANVNVYFIQLDGSSNGMNPILVATLDDMDPIWGADVRNGVGDATLFAIADSQRAFTWNTSIPIQKTIDTNTFVFGIPSISSPTIGRTQAAWAWWQDVEYGYEIRSMNVRENGNPAGPLPFRSHGDGFQVHADRGTLVWVATDRTGEDPPTIVHWTAGQPNGGSALRELPVTVGAFDHVQPHVAQNAQAPLRVVGWTEEGVGYVVVIP